MRTFSFAVKLGCNRKSYFGLEVNSIHFKTHLNLSVFGIFYKTYVKVDMVKCKEIKYSDSDSALK